MSSDTRSEMFSNAASTVNRMQAEIVCRCLEVTDLEIRTAIETCGAETVREVGRCTGAGQGCTVCHCAIRAILENR